ncbi:MAG: DUF4115 domain-containing protein [Elusimicrobia bacterium]|nr:DUF4115 domain-containing protein [Elusimicrobiota bacterium]
MDNLGKKLKEARLQKGLSLEAIYQEIRISKSILQAMESDDWKTSLHPIYAQFFLKSYSQYLGLPWEEAPQPAESPTPAPAPPISPSAPTAPGWGEGRRLAFPLLPFLAFGALILLGLGYWSYEKTRSPRTHPEPAEEPSTAYQALPSPVWNLKIQAQERVWVRLETGRRLLLEGTLAPAQSHAWRLTRPVSIRVNTPQFLKLTFNGKPLSWDTLPQTEPGQWILNPEEFPR